jgi:ABC-type sugar transport system substrate-binding protein
MRRWKLLLPLAIAAAAVITATGASTAGGAPKKIRVAVFLASAANTYWTASLQGAKDTAKKYGNVEITAFDGEFNTTKQLNQLRDALISKKFDAWYIGPNDGQPLVPTINKAIKQGVKVACTLVPCGPIGKPVAGPGQVAFIGVPFYANGQQLGQLVKQGCKGIANCKVAWLPGLPELPLEKLRTQGLYSVIGKDKNIHVVSVQAGGYLAAPALKATQNILQAHSDLNVIVSSGDQMIAGAYRAAKLAGYPDGKIKMYGNGCTFEAKQLILQGKQAGCTVYLPRTEGKMAVDLLVRAVGGERITGRSIDPLTLSPIGPIGTKANIAKFTPEFHS